MPSRSEKYIGVPPLINKDRAGIVIQVGNFRQVNSRHLCERQVGL